VFGNSLIFYIYRRILEVFTFTLVTYVTYVSVCLHLLLPLVNRRLVPYDEGTGYLSIKLCRYISKLHRIDHEIPVLRLLQKAQLVLIYLQEVLNVYLDNLFDISPTR